MMGRKFEKVSNRRAMFAYTKKASFIAKKIQIAVKQGGANPDSNRQLGLVIREAQANDVPRDVVDRNIKKASEPNTADFKELTYEVFGAGGVGFIVNALSDNSNRAKLEVTTLVRKTKGCKMATSGSVAFQFAKRGRVAVNTALTEEAMIELAIEAGVDDAELVAPDEGLDGERVHSVVLVAPTALAAMQGALQDAGHGCAGRLAMVPTAALQVSDADLELNLAAIDVLEECGDVDSVEHNMQIPR